MNQSPNIFNTILIAVLSILYVVILPVLLLVAPAIEFLSSPENINNTIDSVEVEKQILTRLSQKILQETIAHILPVNINLPEQDLENLLVTEDLISWISQNRRELIRKIYHTLENGTPLSFDPQYKGTPNLLVEMIAQYTNHEYSDLPYCSEIATSPTEIDDPVEQGCKKDIIYFPETLFHDTADTDKNTPLPRLEIKKTEAQTVSKLFTVVKELPKILVITGLTLAFLIIFLSASKKTALVFVGAYTATIGIATFIFWKMAPTLILKHNPITIETEDTIFADFHDTINNIFTKLIQEALIQIGESTFDKSIAAAIAGIFLLIAGIFLFRKHRPANQL